jgi:nitroreductase
MDILEEMVDLGRMSPFGGNVQSLRYILSNDAETNGAIFNTLGWAKYLTDWDGPEIGERPSSYVIMLNETALFANAWCEAGIAAQSVLLGAAERGLGGCMFRNVKRDELTAVLGIEAKYEILMVLAVGKPTEKIVIEALDEGRDFKYWRDAQNTHYVPKRRLRDVVLKRFGRKDTDVKHI